MHELLLTAAVKDADLEKACAILQGLCWMSARHNVYHVTFFAGLPRPRALPHLKALQSSRQFPQWNEFSRELTRSSYTFQVQYEVLVDRDFGTGKTLDHNTTPGTLRWLGFPDPQREKGQLVTYRKKIEIPNHMHLISILTNNGQG
jgi:mediator of RNA polymerase II transcription subunit 18, fungi type